MCAGPWERACLSVLLMAHSTTKDFLPQYLKHAMGARLVSANLSKETQEQDSADISVSVACDRHGVGKRMRMNLCRVRTCSMWRLCSLWSPKLEDFPVPFMRLTLMLPLSLVCRFLRRSLPSLVGACVHQGRDGRESETRLHSCGSCQTPLSFSQRVRIPVSSFSPSDPLSLPQRSSD